MQPLKGRNGVYQAHAGRPTTRRVLTVLRQEARGGDQAREERVFFAETSRGVKGSLFSLRQRYCCLLRVSLIFSAQPDDRHLFLTRLPYQVSPGEFGAGFGIPIGTTPITTDGFLLHGVMFTNNAFHRPLLSRLRDVSGTRGSLDQKQPVESVGGSAAFQLVCRRVE